MKTARQVPQVVRYPKTPGANPSRLRLALGTIPYTGPVIRPSLGMRPEPRSQIKRARD